MCEFAHGFDERDYWFGRELPGSRDSNSYVRYTLRSLRIKPHSKLPSPNISQLPNYLQASFNANHNGSQIREEASRYTRKAQRQERQAEQEVSRILEDLHLQGVPRLQSCSAPQAGCVYDR